MTHKFTGLLIAGLLLVIGFIEVVESRPTTISVWAPGMEEPQEFDSRGGDVQVDLNSDYWAYVIKGVSGGISLGNEIEEGQFWSIDDGSTTSSGIHRSWASVGLEVNGHAFMEEGAFFSVSGDEPGVSSDPTTTYFPKEYVLHADADGKLTLSLSVLINSGLFEHGEGSANMNPTVELTLLADIYRKPPETSGNLTTGSVLSSRTGRVALTWDFTQGREGSSAGLIELATR